MTAQEHGQLSPTHLICKCGDPECDWEAASRTQNGFTAGPWRVDERGSVVAEWSELRPVKIGDGAESTTQTGLIALVYGCPEPGELYSDDNLRANRRLIAAAPDLLAKLVEIAGTCAECDGTARRCMGLSEEPCEDCADIREVIAKATAPQQGGQS